MPYRGPFDSLEAFNAGVQLEPARFIVEDYLTWTENGIPTTPAVARGRRRLPQTPSPSASSDSRKAIGLCALSAELHATNDKLSKGGVIDVDFPGAARRMARVQRRVVQPLGARSSVRSMAGPSSDAALERLQSSEAEGAAIGIGGRCTRSSTGARLVTSATLEALRPRIAFRDGTHATNSRTVLAALIPPTGLCRKPGAGARVATWRRA